MTVPVPSTVPRDPLGPLGPACRGPNPPLHFGLSPCDNGRAPPPFPRPPARVWGSDDPGPNTTSNVRDAGPLPHRSRSAPNQPFPTQLKVPAFPS